LFSEPTNFSLDKVDFIYIGGMSERAGRLYCSMP
jgi:hypothetical protein